MPQVHQNFLTNRTLPTIACITGLKMSRPEQAQRQRKQRRKSPDSQRLSPRDLDRSRTSQTPRLTAPLPLRSRQLTAGGGESEVIAGERGAMQSGPQTETSLVKSPAKKFSAERSSENIWSRRVDVDPPFSGLLSAYGTAPANTTFLNFFLRMLPVNK